MSELPVSLIRHCGAKTKTGKPCRKYAISGRPRCKFHGGRTLIKHGNRTQASERYYKALRIFFAICTNIEDVIEEPSALEQHQKESKAALIELYIAESEFDIMRLQLEN